MAGHQAFPDVELMLCGDGDQKGFLETFGACYTELPPALATDPAGLLTGPVLRVTRVGGGEGTNKTADEPHVLVQVFTLRDAANPRQAHDVAAQIRAAMLNAAAVTPWGRFDSATTESGPAPASWPDQRVRAVQMTFRLRTRR